MGPEDLLGRLDTLVDAVWETVLQKDFSASVTKIREAQSILSLLEKSLIVCDRLNREPPHGEQ